MRPASVTVVVPTRDRPHLLRDTVASIAAQRGVDVDIVIVDDGSRDDHAATIRDVAAEHPAHVVRNERSQGVAAARNQGIAAAATPWVAFCDDDDLWVPEKLEGQLLALETTARRWAYAGAVKFAAGPTIWQVMPPPSPDHVRARLADKCIIPAGASNVIASTALLRDVGGFDEELQHLADWDLWLRLLEDGPPAAAVGIAVAYRLHTRAMSLNPAGILTEARTIDTRWRHLRGDRALDLAPTHLWIAMSHLRAGQRPQAALAYLRAARHDPKRGLRGILRSLHPQPPRPAHTTGPSDVRGSRFERTDVVSVPASVRRLLEGAGSGADGRGRE